MRVSRIEVFGFKSFMERTVLPLNSGITGVVGPNGCGKSNIVDALRWVLGETRAKNLRGSISEDVIFNGTEKLRPLGLAEVTITLRSDQSSFFDDLRSPALDADSSKELSGVESETKSVSALNKIISELVPSEAKETKKNQADPLSLNLEGLNSETPDLKLSSDSSKIIQFPRQTRASEETNTAAQNDLEQNISEAPSESVSVDGSIQTSTQSSVSKESLQAETFLTKFSWLKNVNEAQVTRRLYRSGESEYFINKVQCRLRDIVELFRAVGLGPRTYTIVAQGEVSRIISARPEERRSILEEAAGVLGFRDKIAAAKRRLEETEVNTNRLKDLIAEVTRQVNSLRRQAARARNREELKAKITQLQHSLLFDRALELELQSSSIDAKRTELEQQEQQASERLAQLVHEEESFRTELISVDVQYDQIRSQVDSIREELQNRERLRNQTVSRLATVRALRRNQSEEAGKLSERLKVLEQRGEQAQGSLTGLNHEVESVSKMLQELEAQGESDLKLCQDELKTIREEAKQNSVLIAQHREKLASVKSALQTIQQQIAAMSPSAQLANFLSEDGERFAAQSLGVLADGISAPSELTTALQAVLAEKAQYVVSDDLEGLAQAFKVRQVKGSERALGVIRSDKAGSLELKSNAEPIVALELDKTLSENGAFKLLERLELKDGFRAAAKHLLDYVYVAPSLEQAIRIFDQIFGKHDVTSDILNNKIESRVVIVTLEGELLTALSFSHLNQSGGLIELKQRVRTLESSEQQLSSALNTLQAESAALEEREKQHSIRLSELTKSAELKARRIRELLQARGQVEGKLAFEKRVREEISSDIERERTSIKKLDERLLALEEEENDLSQELQKQSEIDDGALKLELEQLSKQSQEFEKIRQRGLKDLSLRSQASEQERKNLDHVRTDLSNSTLAIQRIALEREHMYERALEDLGAEVTAQLRSASLEQLRPGALDSQLREESQSELVKLRERLQREGEVDPESIVRFEEESKRLTELNKHLEDLEHAAQTLKGSVTRLSELSKQRFVETFEAVSKSYSALVPKLFGGGSAELKLLDPANPLESGVEIIARPPGKKLRSIELLSGGEKALCAISLIMSMFMHRPSPICVLDEVDAPLDEANVIRFLNLVREMAAHTQFLVITHNKQSMSVCERLVGVTMPDPGASKIVTVSLEEAEKHAVNS